MTYLESTWTLDGRRRRWSTDPSWSRHHRQVERRSSCWRRLNVAGVEQTWRDEDTVWAAAGHLDLAHVARRPATICSQHECVKYLLTTHRYYTIHKFFWCLMPHLSYTWWLQWLSVGLVIERSLVRLPVGALSSQLDELSLPSLWGM